MLGTVSLVWGIAAVIGMVVAFMPCLGSLNWLNIPFAAVGLVVSLVATGQPESRNGGRTGSALCGLAVVVGLFRLLLGGGIF